MQRQRIVDGRVLQACALAKMNCPAIISLETSPEKETGEANHVTGSPDAKSVQPRMLFLRLRISRPL